jgi:hypothetical protein
MKIDPEEIELETAAEVCATVRTTGRESSLMRACHYEELT